jgi:exodeoxyribonuclease-3
VCSSDLPALADRLVVALVDALVGGWYKTSDHAPVWIELADKPKRRRKATARQTA